MAGKYLSYAEYKDSGVEWLGEIPTHWSRVALKYITANKVKDGPHETPNFIDDGIPFLSVDGIQNNELVFDGCRYISKEDHQRFSLKCRPVEGDVLLGKAASVGKVAYVDTVLEFNVWSPLAVITPSTKTSGKFVFYSTQSAGLQAQCELRSNSNTQKNLGMGDIDNLFYAVPNKAEQTQIANFLDHETAKIDTLIAKQQQLIKLLKEKRQAVISHAVTKGLNPDAPMKDSGVEWLGEVPEHWTVLSLGKITDDKCDGPFGSGLKSEHYTERGVLVIRLQNIKATGYHDGKGAFIDEGYYKNNLSNHDVMAGDVLIAGLGDSNNPVGRACVAPEGIAPAMVKADCFRFRLNLNKVIPNFIAKQLSISAQTDAGKLSNGSTRARIPLNTMSTRKVAICPLDEQAQLLKHIDVLSDKYDKLECAASKAVKLLKERRIALISAAVTGKIDVRNWKPA